jgi:hypothetical protein
MRISNGNIGIGTTAPANALDVSGTLRVIGAAGDITFTNGNINLAGVPVISSTGVLSNASTTSNSIGGVTLNNGVVSNASSSVNAIGGVFLSSCNATTGTFTTNSSLGSNNIGGVTLSNSNAIVGGFLRNALTPTTYDISGGNISNSLTTTSSNLRVAAGSVSAPAVAFTTSTNTGLYGSATGHLDVATGGFRCMNLNGGGVTTYLGLTAAGTTPQLRINATTGLNNMISFNSTAAGALVIGNQVAGLPDGQFGVSTDAGATASLRVATSGIVVPGHIRDALVPSTLDISGGNISNSGTTRSANFLAVPGGASRPGYAFTTDPSSGIDLPGTSQIAFETAGVQRMVISNANVGIGTTAPAFALDVSGVTNVQTAGAGGTLNVGGTSGLFMFCDAVTTKHGYIRALGSTANLYLGTSNTNHMVITNAGRVGIGTGDPGATLDVSGGVVRVQRVYNGLANALVIADSTAAPIARWGVGILNAATGSESGGNDFAINAYSDSVVASTPLMITRSNGNVGIGGGAASSPRHSESRRDRSHLR